MSNKNRESQKWFCANELSFLADLPELMSHRLGGRQDMEPIRQRELISAYTSYLRSLAFRTWSEPITAKDVGRIKVAVKARLRYWERKPEGYVPPKPRVRRSKLPRRG